MQENRSFDHYYGCLPGVRGFGDPKAMTLSTGKSVFHQPDPENPDGYLLPFRLDTHRTNAQFIPSTSHAWEVQHASWNNGKMDNWMKAHRPVDGKYAPYVMGYYNREDLPFHYALAESFSICDNYFCSAMGPTWPNRMYWMTGMLDPEGHQGGPVLDNTPPEHGFEWTTYPERLQNAGVSWRVYQEADEVDLNVLKHFKQFREAPTTSPLYQNGMRQTAPDQFEKDAAAGTLPTVSWLIPELVNSEHPNKPPAAGAYWLESKISAITSNPTLWHKTVIIINYDENDGMFDHVPPPVAPKGTPQEFVEGVPIGAGFRVPALVISPWTVGGWVTHEALDHTSVLRFLEKVTGVKEPNISPWRRKTFGDFTSLIRLDREAVTAPPLPDTLEQLKQVYRNVTGQPDPTLPGANQTMPVQPKGSLKDLG